MDVNSLSHTKWNCKYHIVFAMILSITHRCVNFTKAGCCSMLSFPLMKNPKAIASAII